MQGRAGELTDPEQAMPAATPRPHGSAREKGGKTTLTASHFSLSGLGFVSFFKTSSEVELRCRPQL